MKKIILFLMVVVPFNIVYGDESGDSRLDPLREILSRHEVTIGSLKFPNNLLLTFERNSEFPAIIRAHVFEIMSSGERRDLGYSPQQIVLTLNEGKWRAGVTFYYEHAETASGIATSVLAIELRGLMALGEVFPEKAYIAGDLDVREEIVDQEARFKLKGISPSGSPFDSMVPSRSDTQQTVQVIRSINGSERDRLIGSLSDELARDLAKEIHKGQSHFVSSEWIRSFFVDRLGKENIDIALLVRKQEGGFTNLWKKINYNQPSLLDFQILIRTLLREVIRCKK